MPQTTPSPASRPAPPRHHGPAATPFHLLHDSGRRTPDVAATGGGGQEQESDGGGGCGGCLCRVPRQGLGLQQTLKVPELLSKCPVQAVTRLCDGGPSTDTH
ncbi:hypothetical protein O3P69_015639 [Scylla paramamosain]|uniref:Uncharacterized protein n=1 Tax=Scylla paramamosain TaxID=85552 RepID=A0AAW0SH77_SCYPA